MVLIPGGRDVRATLEDPPSDTRRAVVACPPHPEMGGSRTDARLRAVADALVERDVACLRFDYGDWDRGYGERSDAQNAVGWARERFERVGIFGFSFGGAIAVLAGAGLDPGPDAVSALAPASKIASDLDAAAVLDELGCPVQVVFGERDSTADWEPLVERARELDYRVEAFPADHFFVGQRTKVARLVGEFFGETL